MTDQKQQSKLTIITKDSNPIIPLCSNPSEQKQDNILSSAFLPTQQQQTENYDDEYANIGPTHIQRRSGRSPSIRKKRVQQKQNSIPFKSAYEKLFSSLPVSSVSDVFVSSST